jgi:hypothetical protein
MDNIQSYDGYIGISSLQTFRLYLESFSADVRFRSLQIYHLYSVRYFLTPMSLSKELPG